jgi:hypothetical protein
MAVPQMNVLSRSSLFYHHCPKTRHWTVICLCAFGSASFADKNQLRSGVLLVSVCLKY